MVWSFQSLNHEMQSLKIDIDRCYESIDIAKQTIQEMEDDLKQCAYNYLREIYQRSQGRYKKIQQDSKMEKRSFGNNESTIKGTEIYIMMPHFIPPDLMIITVIIILLFSFTL